MGFKQLDVVYPVQVLLRSKSVQGNAYPCIVSLECYKYGVQCCVYPVKLHFVLWELMTGSFSIKCWIKPRKTLYRGKWSSLVYLRMRSLSTITVLSLLLRELGHSVSCVVVVVVRKWIFWNLEWLMWGVGEISFPSVSKWAGIAQPATGTTIGVRFHFRQKFFSSPRS
jgi:hypothetical protein